VIKVIDLSTFLLIDKQPGVMEMFELST